MGLNDVHRLLSEEKTAEALELLRKLEKESLLYPKVLVLTALCLMTLDEGDTDVDALEEILEQALRIDEDHLPALVELAHFKLNVQNDARDALPLFERASQIAQMDLTEATLGHAQCIAELKSRESAVEFIETQKANAIDPDRLREFMENLEKYY